MNAEGRDARSRVCERNMDVEPQTISGIGARLAELKAMIKEKEKFRVSESEIAEAFTDADTFWRDLFPSERQRLVSLLIGGITIRPDGLEIVLKTGGMLSLARELCDNREENR